mmetsp:Transcript_2976/g.4691  ORF Transcript_2976/g.4691 Transcript_2976/m.4691 type:complete len:80 (+) Transcript_2976:20-259(+)
MVPHKTTTTIAILQKHYTTNSYSRTISMEGKILQSCKYSPPINVATSFALLSLAQNALADLVSFGPPKHWTIEIQADDL